MSYMFLCLHQPHIATAAETTKAIIDITTDAISIFLN